MLVVDLFCGMGGFSTGAERAGARVVLAIDSWADALATHALNHPRAAHVQMTLGGSLEAMRRLIRQFVPVGEAWHLHASPPCQKLSASNRLNPSLRGGMRLVYWCLALVAACKPTSWSLEQVPAARAGLLRRGVRCSIVNAADFGVPQARRRCFAGQGWTLPQPGRGPSVGLVDWLPWVAKEATHIRGNTNSCSVYSKTGRHLGNRKLVGMEGFRSIAAPCTTLLANGRRIQLYFKSPKDPANAAPSVMVRDLTPREYLRLQGFPDNYRFPKGMTDKTKYLLIGNSLVPELAYLILRSAQATTPLRQRAF